MLQASAGRGVDSEENKERYYETLEASSNGWRKDKHDAWHLINYLLYILKQSYKNFEERADVIASPRGEKTAMIEAAITSLPNEFRIAELRKLVPGASLDMIRKVLRDKKNQGLLTPSGRGQNATWKKN